jgi:hypothetical protein
MLYQLSYLATRSRETACGSSQLYQTSHMDATSRAVLWGQFGAAIDMLENAIRSCPEELWADRTRQPEFWYLAYHTLFFLDFYLADAAEGFAPPAPFTLSELDFAGVLPDRVYQKEELLAFLEYGRNKARARIETLTPELAARRCNYGWFEPTRLEALFYSMRHVQHHAAQLNLLLRQAAIDPPRWVARAEA